VIVHFRAGIANHLGCAVRAPSAARSDAERRFEVGERARTKGDGTPDFPIGNRIAEADVHGLAL
jgi:hypothetical protein